MATGRRTGDAVKHWVIVALAWLELLASAYFGALALYLAMNAVDYANIWLWVLMGLNSFISFYFFSKSRRRGVRIP